MLNFSFFPLDSVTQPQGLESSWEGGRVERGEQFLVQTLEFGPNLADFGEI